MKEARNSQPIVLIASRNYAMARSLESVFEDDGYIPARVSSLSRVSELARRASYDVIVLDQGPDEQEPLEVARTLRDDPAFDHSTPIVITSTSIASKQGRLAAYEAGAWEYLTHPIDLELVLAKLRTFLRARGELIAAQSRSLIDSRSGLYTPFGLQQVALTLGAGAARKHQAFACVAFSPDRRFADVASVFRAQSRRSDVVGRMGESRLAILAPDTDAPGARLLVARLQRELDKAATEHTIPYPVRLRAGYSAVPDLATARIEVEDLVHRAESALDQALLQSGGNNIIGFGDIPS